MNSLVTIIVPAYNASTCIKACLDSIIAQSFTEWEAVIIDDGSTDDTQAICEMYSKDNRFRFFSKSNGGVSSARNAGIRMVHTPYFVFVDSDDTLESDYLEVLIRARERYPNAGHIWCGYQIVQGQEITPQLIDPQKDVSIFSRSNMMYLYSKWYLQMPWHRLFDTKTVIENNLLMDETLSLGEDLIFNLDYINAVANTEIVIVNVPCYNYSRSNKDSLDFKYRSNLCEIYRKLDDALWGYARRWGLDKTEENLFYDSKFYHYEAIMRNTFHDENKQTTKEKIRLNNQILSSQDFQNTMEKTSCFIHPLYRMAYKLKHYELVLFINKLVLLGRLVK